MKRTNKAFTIVEVIIVIAVIGILAAILVLALPKAIEEAHEKSALSDAKNTLTETAIEINPSDNLNKNYIIIVEKYEKEYVFSCEDGGEITPYELNPFGQSVRRELADALCDMGLVQAPLGLNEITLDEQFDNVTLFTGGKLQSPQRIDVEVNCDIDLPTSGILGVTWKTDNSSVASIQNGKIHGKTVGKTILTGMCDDIRIAYSLYVGKHAEVETFAELKAACEDSSESVFIYPKYEGEDSSTCLFEASFEQLPVTIRKDKQVSFCPTMVKDEEGEETGNFCNIEIIYRYSNVITEDPEFFLVGEPVEAVFINDGGIMNLDMTHINLENRSSYEEGGYIPDTGSCIINRNGGIVNMKNDTELINAGLPIPVGGPIFGMPFGQNYDEETFARTEAIIEASKQTTAFALLNESGDVTSDRSYATSVHNCDDGTYKASDSKGIYTFDRMVNDGVIYTLSGIRAGTLGGYDYKFINIINSGIIYEIKDVDFQLVNGGTAIDSSGEILSISDCKFTKKEFSMESITRAPFNLSSEQAQEYLAKPAVPIRISGGRIGEITDCEFDCDSIVFDGCTPFSCVKSGKFREKPDDVILYGNSTCIYDEAEEVYIVRIDNGQVTIVN